MKKLIASLAAVSLTVGSSASILTYSINANKTRNSELSAQQKEISLVLEQVAKSMSLNQSENGGYNFDYLFNNIVKNQQIKWLNSDIALDESSNLTGYNRYYELYDKNFGKNLMASDVVVENFTFEEGIAPKESSMGSLVSTISGILPMVTKFIANGDIFGMVAYLLQTFISINPAMISDFALLKFAKALLPDENIESLSKAFDADRYNGYTVQEALNSSIIGLVNGFGAIAGTNAEFENDSVADTNKNFEDAMLELESISSSLLSKITTLDFDLAVNFNALVEVINFARVLMVYLNAYISEASSGSLKAADVQNQTLSFDEIETLRSKQFSTYANEFDIKEFLIYLQEMIKNDSGMGLKNLIGVLFVEKPKEEYQQLQLQISDLVSEFSILSQVGNITNGDFSGLIDPALDLLGSIKNFIAANSKTDYSTNFGLSSLFKATLNGVVNFDTLLTKLPESMSQYAGVIDTLLGLSNAKIGTLLANVLGMMSSDVSIMNQRVQLFTDLKTFLPLVSQLIGSLAPEFAGIVEILKDVLIFDLNDILAPTDKKGEEQDPFENLWSGKKTDFSGFLGLLGIEGVTNLRSIFTQPVNSILGSGLLGLNTDKSIQGMVDEMVTTIGDDELKINFDNFEGLIINLKGVLDIALNDPTKLLETLGLNPDKTIKPGSALDYIQKIFADLTGIKAITDQLSYAADFYEEQQAELKKEMSLAFNNLKTTSWEVIDNNNYKYTVNGLTVQFTLKNQSDKYVISKIVVE